MEVTAAIRLRRNPRELIPAESSVLRRSGTGLPFWRSVDSETISGPGICILQTGTHIFQLFKKKKIFLGLATRRVSDIFRSVVLCHCTLAFILSVFLQGATQVLLLRTQINGTGCNTGSRRFLPFSPLVTPTHPLNSSVVLTNGSNDQVALPRRGKMAGPWPCV